MDKLKWERFFKSKIFIALAILFFIFLICMIYIGMDVLRNARLMESSYTTTNYFPPYPPINTQGKTAEQVALIQKGEYLVKVGDCIACHTDTAHKGPAFGGGLAMQTPFGVLYTPNITADKNTGLSDWTDAQFIKAMREGIAPNGDYYYPAFPYPYFNMVTDDDLKAIKAYLDNIPPVHKKNRVNDMVWPFNWRFLQLGWRLLFFDAYNKGPYKANPRQTPEWNRGAYLVEGLGHCGMCHTPSYTMGTQQLPLAAPIRKYNLTGANVQGYLAPNITKTNLGAIPDNDLLQVFTQNKLIGGGQVQGPMLEAIHDSLMHLTTADLLAMITYLKTVQSTIPPQSKPGASGMGESIYNSYCLGCHATGIGGAPKMGDVASWNFLIQSGMDKVYYVAIHGGGNMPAKGTCITCSNLQIKQAVDYMVAKTLEGEESAKIPVPKLSMRDGQQIYQTNCSSCHSKGVPNVPQLGDKQAWKSINDQGFLRTYRNVISGGKGHPVHGGCAQCSDEQLLITVKYMMQEGASNKNYILW